MGRYDNTKRNQYNSTPRKVFDAYIDRMGIKRRRDKEDHRADIHALLLRITNLETMLTQLSVQYEVMEAHMAQHCEQLDAGREGTHKDA